MLSLTVLLLVAVTGIFSASTVPKCTPDVIKKVTDHWNATKKIPENVMTSTHNKVFKVIGGTGSEIAKQGKCKSFQFGKGELYDITDKKHLPCTEEKGILTLPDSSSYLIDFDKDILCTLRCSGDGPEPTDDSPAIVALAVFGNPKKEDITAKYNLLAAIGFKVIDYQCK